MTCILRNRRRFHFAETRDQLPDRAEFVEDFQGTECAVAAVFHVAGLGDHTALGERVATRSRARVIASWLALGAEARGC